MNFANQVRKAVTVLLYLAVSGTIGVSSVKNKLFSGWPKFFKFLKITWFNHFHCVNLWSGVGQKYIGIFVPTLINIVI